ncbi:MAG: UvrB/UvrC motif-containing protein [Clostridiales bacterium]|jgi:protein arginine kinase activator|nr:UvrB/UvrC motif-containing protein [Clostridiales bacterium]
MCKISLATVFLKRIINGLEENICLCGECAEKLEDEIIFENLFQGFISELLTLSENKDDNIKKGENKQVLVCPNCGTSLENFKSNMKFGCSICYTTFGSEVSNLLKRIQKGLCHVGKISSRYLNKSSSSVEIERLRIALKRAIEQEDYELAARLRDQIKKDNNK